MRVFGNKHVMTMKRTIFYRIGCLACLTWILASCEADTSPEGDPVERKQAVLRLEGAHAVQDLATPLYLFRRPAGTEEEYVLDTRYATIRDGQTLKLPVADLNSYDYRFLMIAQPADEEWLSLTTASGSPYTPGNVWSDLRMISSTGEASADGYYSFTDRTGAELLAGGIVRMTLGRIAGRVRFDCFRIGASLAEPTGVVSPDVESVLDRIDRIEITYENPTAALRFGADNTLVPAGAASRPFVQTVRPDLTDFKVALPQPDNGLNLFETALRGSLRMEGTYLLPSESALRITMVFHYYDTTPVCGSDHAGSHTVGCYEQKQVILHLPAADTPNGLPVASDCYTVNRAGLRCDRIIDVAVGGSIQTDFGWQ